MSVESAGPGQGSSFRFDINAPATSLDLLPQRAPSRQGRTWTRRWPSATRCASCWPRTTA